MKITTMILMIMISTTSTNTIICSDFALIKKNYKQFTGLICPFPTNTNTIDAIAGTDHHKQTHIVNYAQESYPLIDDRVITLCHEFISFKKKYGTSVEQSLYKNMALSDFIIRCLEKRPLVFMNASDDCKLRKPNAKLTSMDFTKIGTIHQQQSELSLNDYLSYDEIKIAALIGVSSPTCFINAGDRNNAGIKAPKGSFHEEGVYVGLVGARFEKENFMEWQDIIITESQNTHTKGYGLEHCNEGLIKLWSDLYGCTFPTYQEAQMDTTGQYSKHHHHFFNKKAYKKRIELVVKPFLRDANERGKKQNKKVYVHTVGLGLGVWAVLQEEQTQCMIEVYKEIIKNNAFPSIADIDFSWFANTAPTLVPDMNNNSVCMDKENNAITIHFSKRNPADKLNDANKLLVACYAWDGNAYPGNEYWAGMLTATGDPAAACCSLIATLQNILINPWLKENSIKKWGPISSTKNVNAEKSNASGWQSFVRSAVGKTILSISGLVALGYYYFFHHDNPTP